MSEEQKPFGGGDLAPVVGCGCYRCTLDRVQINPQTDGLGGTDSRLHRMFLCAVCGNKRCPHAANHRLACTNSNEPGQPGSMYEDAPRPPSNSDACPVRITTELATLELPQETKDRLAAANFHAFSDIVGSRREELAVFGITDDDIAALERALGCSFVHQPVVDHLKAGEGWPQSESDPFVQNAVHNLSKAGAQAVGDPTETDDDLMARAETGVVDRAVFRLLQRKDAALREAQEQNAVLHQAVEVLDASRKRWLSIAAGALITLGVLAGAAVTAWLS